MARGIKFKRAMNIPKVGDYVSGRVGVLHHGEFIENARVIEVRKPGRDTNNPLGLTEYIVADSRGGHRWMYKHEIVRIGKK